MGEVINVGLIQMSCGDNVQENFEKTIAYIKEATYQGANIICTQELFKSRYFCQVVDKDQFRLAEVIDENNATLQLLQGLASEFGVVIIASLFEKRTTGLYHNTAIVIDADGSFLGKYRKMHIPDDPLYFEKFYFTPGDLGYRVFKTRYADIGVLICWDQWFPEAARLIALQGAEIIFIPTAIGFIPSRREMEGASYQVAWQVVQRGHAVANGCYLAAVNRVGFEENPKGMEGLYFWGQSFVSDPYGKIVKAASENHEEILLCPVDLSFVENARDNFSFPYRDRRVDSYMGLTKRFLD